MFSLSKRSLVPDEEQGECIAEISESGGLGAFGPASGPKRRSLNIILVQKRQMVRNGVSVHSAQCCGGEVFPP